MALNEILKTFMESLKTIQNNENQRSDPAEYKLSVQFVKKRHINGCGQLIFAPAIT